MHTLSIIAKRALGVSINALDLARNLPPRGWQCNVKGSIIDNSFEKFYTLFQLNLGFRTKVIIFAACF